MSRNSKSKQNEGKHKTAAPASKTQNQLPQPPTNNSQVQTEKPRDWTKPVILGLIIAILATIPAYIALVPEDQRVNFVTFPTPLAGATAVTEGDGREVLVLIAKFDQMSGNPLEPDKEWKIVLDKAAAQLQGKVNTRIIQIPEVIHSHDEARRLSNAYNATLVIWGSVRGAALESNYTTTPRWGEIDREPGQTQVQGLIPELSLFVSPGGDSQYVLYFVVAQLSFYEKEEYSELALPFIDYALANAPEGREAAMGVDAMYFMRAYLNHDSDQIQAMSDLQQTIKLNPNFAPAYNNLGSLYLSHKDYLQATQSIDKAIEVSENNEERAGYLFNRSIVNREAGDYEQALDDLSRAIDLESDAVYSSIYFYSRAHIYQDNLGLLEQALIEYSKTIENNPLYAPAYNNRGTLYLQKNNYEEAINDFTNAMTKNPDTSDYNDDDAIYLNNRGYAYTQLGKNDEAKADFSRAIELDPGFKGPYFQRAELYSKLKEYELAIVDANTAISLDSNNTIYYVDRGHINYELGNYEEALTDFSSAISLDPNNADAYIHRGNTHNFLKSYSLAIYDFNRAIDLDPNNSWAYTMRGNSYRDQQDYPKAIDDYLHSIEIDPTDAYTYEELGNTYYEQGNFDGSLESYKQYLVLAGDESEQSVRDRVAQLEEQRGTFMSTAETTAEPIS